MNKPKEYIFYNERHQWIAYGFEGKCMGVGAMGYNLVHTDSKNRCNLLWINKNSNWMPKEWILIGEL